MHVNERKETYQVKRKPWKRLKITWERGLEWERVIWEVNRCGQIEEMRTGSWSAYIYILSNSRQIEVSRGVEPFVEKNNANRCNCQGGVEKQKKARSIPQLSRSYRGSRNFLNRSTKYRGSVKIAIRKSLEAQQIAKCQGGVELAFKNGFLTREKYRHECNQARNSTKDPISNLNSQNHLLTTILST